MMDIVDDKLEELKKQVRKTSCELNRLEQIKDANTKKYTENENNIKENNVEMKTILDSLFDGNEKELDKLFELVELGEQIKIQLERINDNLSKLNECITDTTSIESLYKAKNDILEQEYTERKKCLESHIKSLTEHLEQLNQQEKTKTKYKLWK